MVVVFNKYKTQEKLKSKLSISVVYNLIEKELYKCKNVCVCMYNNKDSKSPISGQHRTCKFPKTGERSVLVIVIGKLQGRTPPWLSIDHWA